MGDRGSRMTQTVSIHATQYRLARHYLNKLRTADAAVRRGQASVSYGLTLFDQEWEQIRHWQAWAARSAAEDAARLTRDFPLAGLEVLANRNNLIVTITTALSPRASCKPWMTL